MPFRTPETVYPTQRPLGWADEQMADEALTDHGHVLDGRNRTGTLGYLARMRDFMQGAQVDVPGASIVGTILFPVKIVDEKGKERPAQPMEAWGASVKVGEEAAQQFGRACVWAAGLLMKKVAPPIDRIKSFDWSEGAKPVEPERGTVERMARRDEAYDDVYAAYPNRPRTGVPGQAGAAQATALPGPVKALEDKRPKQIAGPPKALPRPDRGQDR